jgi:hypothetical protein
LTLLPESLARAEPGREQVISVEDWAEIRRLYRAEGLPIRQIAKLRGISRNTVRAAVRSDGPPRYERALQGSVADGFEPRIRELLRTYPAMPSTVIAERVGWPYSIRTLSGRVAELGVHVATRKFWSDIPDQRSRSGFSDWGRRPDGDGVSRAGQGDAAWLRRPSAGTKRR